MGSTNHLLGLIDDQANLRLSITLTCVRLAVKVSAKISDSLVCYLDRSSCIIVSTKV